MNPQDLDVFVLTYNRAHYLKCMLDSLCSQTITGFTIKILDNASTDQTSQVICEIQSKYPLRNIIHIRHRTNIGNYNNFKKTQELADNKYTAVFHDDDIIHPEYLETAISLFDRHPEAVMLSSNVEYMFNPNNSNFSLLNRNYFHWDKELSVFLMLLVTTFNFINIIYKTEAYKKISYKPDIYGKNLDNAVLFEMASNGSVLYVWGAGARYRQHSNSDSNNLTTGPFSHELVALLKMCRSKMPQSFVSCVLLYQFSSLLITATKIQQITFDEFIEQCVQDEVFSKKEIKIIRNKFIYRFARKKLKKLKKVYIKSTGKSY